MSGASGCDGGLGTGRWRCALRPLLIGLLGVALAACSSSGPRTKPGSALVGPDGRLRVSIGARAPAGFTPILPLGCELPCAQSINVIPPENGQSRFQLVLVSANPGPPIVEEEAMRYEIGRVPAARGVPERVVLFVSVRDGTLAIRAFDRASRAELPVQRIAF